MKLSDKILKACRFKQAFLFVCYFNPFMSSELCYVKSLDRSINNRRDVWLVFFILPCFIANPEFHANSVDPDQKPRYAASDLGLHCLPISILWDARHKLIEQSFLLLNSIVMFLINKRFLISHTIW